MKKTIQSLFGNLTWAAQANGTLHTAKVMPLEQVIALKQFDADYLAQHHRVFAGINISDVKDGKHYLVVLQVDRNMLETNGVPFHLLPDKLVTRCSRNLELSALLAAHNAEWSQAHLPESEHDPLPESKHESRRAFCTLPRELASMLMSYLKHPDNLGEEHIKRWKEDPENAFQPRTMQLLPCIPMTPYQLERCMSPELYRKVVGMLYPLNGKPGPLIEGDGFQHRRLQGPDSGRNQPPL